MEEIMDKTSETLAEDVVVPLHAEEVIVERRSVAGDTIQVRTVTREREHLVNETVTHGTVAVERVQIGRYVETVPEIREEEETIIVPVVEEVIFVEKKLFLKEEVRLRRARRSEPFQELVTLREQAAVITRVEAQEAPSSRAPAQSQDPRQD
jgi:stress response protein YsnF